MPLYFDVHCHIGMTVSRAPTRRTERWKMFGADGISRRYRRNSVSNRRAAHRHAVSWTRAHNTRQSPTHVNCIQNVFRLDLG